MAGDSRPGSHHDRSGAESRSAFHAGQAPLRSRQAVEQRSDRRALRLPDSRSEHGCRSVGMSQPDVTLALQQPWISVDNDSEGTSPEGLLGQAHPHPRAYGTFPRILSKYVRDDKALRLEDAIRKFTALPAQRMRLADRGVLKSGMWADVVVFDPATVRDRATFDNPNQLSEGMEYVLVNGVPVIDQGKMTGALPGKVLRGPAYVP